jgi:hypothetical protein
LTQADIEQMADKIFAKTRNIPLVDRDFIVRCLQGIASLGDNQVDTRLKQLIRFL